MTLGNARVALAQAEADLAAAEAGLARLIGSPGRVRATDDDLVREIRAAGYTGTVMSGQDLHVY